MVAPALVQISDLSAAVLRSGAWDALVTVGPGAALPTAAVAGEVASWLRSSDAAFDAEITLAPHPTIEGLRCVFAPTGPLDRDHDDVRSFKEAAARGVARARAAGCRHIVVQPAGIPSDARYTRAGEVVILGALFALWEPLEARRHLGEREAEPVERLGIASNLPDDRTHTFTALEHGLRLTRDVCGTNPEDMRPEAIADLCVETFRDTQVRVQVVSDPAQVLTEYPLVHAVGRASLAVRRHQPRVVRLHFRSEGPVTRQILLAGKGVTYDTGGADLKTDGHMAGMSRDKGGAAAVVGIARAVAQLCPPGLELIAEIGCVRNSIGSDAFVADEIITGHSGVRVRIGNTDAEGRLVLADLLSHLRTQAAASPTPSLARIFSIATLTGHAGRAVGPYSIAVDNGPARSAGVSAALAAQGNLLGDPFEVSSLRREDYAFVAPRSRADDLLSCNNAPSSATARGHQFPVAFLMIASGLEQHTRTAPVPLAYTHIDIGGSATEGGDWQHGRPTAASVVALLAAMVAPEL